MRVAVSPAPKVAKRMEDDFIRKTLRVRRTLQQALADLLCNTVVSRRKRTEHVGEDDREILNDELAIRQPASRVAA